LGANTFNRVASVEVTDDWRELGSTAKIELPLLQGKVDKEDTQRSLADLINEGDPVTVSLKWSGRLQVYEHQEFVGFVKRVSPTVPMLVECEDQSYWFRRTNLLKGFGKTTFKALLQYVLSEVESQHGQTVGLLGTTPDINFDKFRFNNVNAAFALQELRKKYGLAIYLKPEGLFAGLAYTDFRGEADYNFYGNIPEGGNQLTWRKQETGTLRVKATSLLKDNRQLTVEVPDGGSGAIRSRYYAGIASESELRQLAEKDLAQLSREGFEGSITGFLTPFVRPGYTARLTDPQYEFRSGSYHVDKVTTTFMPKDGVGIKRKVEIGIRLS
jgi:hypothetical protein